MEYNSLKELGEKLDLLHKLYDSMRLVDPVYKTVIDCQCSSLIETGELCYDFWKNGQVCDNCISIRAFKESKSFMKLEHNQATVYLMTAIPIENNKRPLILELLKNASDSMLVGTGDQGESKLLTQFIDEMNDLVTKDALTSLYNRRFVDERLPADILNAKQKHQPLSLCFFDINNLKTLNDLYGHEAGDWAIKTVGEVLAKNIREQQDWASRYGGDEFVLCFNNTGEKQAHVVAERIKHEIENIPLKYDLDEGMLSITYGIKTITYGIKNMGEISITADEFIRDADQAMYQAKKKKT